MGPERAAFLSQARSDYQLFLFLRVQSQPPCHWLHYLQMCTEKVAKAYFWDTSTPPGDGGHRYFVSFMTYVSGITKVRNGLGLATLSELRNYIRPLIPIARGIEALSPSVAGERENVEYPFPRSSPVTAPIDHPQFAVEPLLIGPDGVVFLAFLDRLFEQFDDWF